MKHHQKLGLATMILGVWTIVASTAVHSEFQQDILLGLSAAEVVVGYLLVQWEKEANRD